MLVFLVAALAGVVSYQLYVATSQMLLLPFLPGSVSGPCFPMSKPHSAHLLGFFIAPLLYDTVVTFLTVGKAISIRRRNGGPSSRLIQTFLREDLRERGSETVSHNQSTGTIAFTAGVTSTKSSPGSPFSGLGFGFGMQGRGGSKTIVRPQGVVLSTIGSIPGDAMTTSMGGLELDHMHGYKADVEAAVYSGEMGLGSPVSGIRVEVEKTTM
ncbi:hypothetical protein TRAPUB_682 [Trametes pubescens]|uniref:Uncharacterized protein n=1 Tax=Trametes pubescens TaxID=154538 RepID=A0A1M2VLM1_TRAPU|nr:hypothetical protein TRAPUB_682 [Trametes pubescens]